MKINLKCVYALLIVALMFMALNGALTFIRNIMSFQDHYTLNGEIEDFCGMVSSPNGGPNDTE